jgi:parallel beta-helix repeat protein
MKTILTLQSFYKAVFRLFLITFLVFFPGIIGRAGAQNKSFLVDSTVSVIDGGAYPYNQVEPGDTILLEAGTRGSIVIRYISGTPENPVIFINSGGVTEIATDFYYAFSIQYCHYIRLTGTGDTNRTYGIRISRSSGGTGIGVGYTSTDFEIDHISIENTLYAGIFAKTDPDCSYKTTRDNFIQYNSSLHDNYFSHNGTEGIYLGSSSYNGQKFTCNGRDTVLLPSVLAGVKVYNNIVEYSGYDGIQVSSASSGCQIYNNTILCDSQSEVSGQMSGILMGGGSKCDCYNNFIAFGKGDGIEDHGLAGDRIFNNIIVDPGLTFMPGDPTQMKHGIFVSDVSAEKDSSFHILFNDIINPKSDGIRFQSSRTRNNLIVSNVIINPGNYDYYQYGNTRFKGIDSYIMLPSLTSQVIFRNNYLNRNFEKAGISARDYGILQGSPLISGAYKNTAGVNFDFLGHPRTNDPLFDVGALEFDQAGSENDTVPLIIRDRPSAFPDPAGSFITIGYRLKWSGEVYISIYNFMGIPQIQKDDYYFQDTVKKSLIDISSLNEGQYIYIIRSGGEVLSGKFIKAE